MDQECLIVARLPVAPLQIATPMEFRIPVISIPGWQIVMEIEFQTTVILATVRLQIAMAMASPINAILPVAWRKIAMGLASRIVARSSPVLRLIAT